MSEKNTLLIVTMLFSAVIISGSLLFFALQIKAGSPENTSNLQTEIEKGIDNYVQKQQQAQVQATDDQAKNVKPVSADDHIYGDPKAEITIIEYSDLECPFCKLFNNVPKQIVDNYNGKVNWAYRHFPLEFHKNSRKEAEASECAADLGGNDKYWEYQEKIFERTTSNGTGFALNALVPLAKEIGLDENKFKDCLDSGKFADKIQQEIDDGKAAGITGTPGNILINHQTGDIKTIEGAASYDDVKSTIDQMLAN